MTLVSPSSGSTVAGTATLTATATSSTDVTGVQFLADGRPVGDEDTTAPYTVAVDTDALMTSGVHLLTARVRTPSAASALSAPARITVANPSACATSTAGQAWPTRVAVSTPGLLTAALTPATAGAVGGLGLGEGPGKVWNDLAVSLTFSDDGTVAALDADHYVSSGVPWTAGETYQVKLVVDVNAHTYAAYIQAPGASTFTRIGTTLRFRSTQQSVTQLDTATVSAGLGSVRACGITVTTPAHLSVTTPLLVTPGQPTAAPFAVTNDGGSPMRIETFVAGNRNAARENVDRPRRR